MTKLRRGRAAALAGALTAMAVGSWGEPAPPGPAIGPEIEPRAAAHADPLAKEEASLRTSLASTAAVIQRSDAGLELWYPVRLAFVADGLELLPTGTDLLDRLAHALREYAHTGVEITVYTDAIGSNEFNLQQSQARAEAVMAYLESKGVEAARLTAKGAGKSALLDAPHTPEGRDLNRRLRVAITPLSS